VISTLEDYRAFYAEEIRAVAGLRSEVLVHAFATVPRERFLGPGPWKIASLGMNMSQTVRYLATADADPRRVYHNVLISLDESRQLNNGQPSALAAWLDALCLKQGERFVHIGAGVGYYTAIAAEAVGPGGSVLAIEVEPELASRARRNLQPWKNVEVVSGDGSRYDPGPADAIFVNAGVTHPAALWLDRLKPGGRLLYPLTFEAGGAGGKGCMILVKRDGERALVGIHADCLAPLRRRNGAKAASARTANPPRVALSPELEAKATRAREAEAQGAAYVCGCDYETIVRRGAHCT